MKIILALLVVAFLCNPNTCRTDDDCLDGCPCIEGVCDGEAGS